VLFFAMAVFGRSFGFFPEDQSWSFLFPCLGPFAKGAPWASPHLDACLAHTRAHRTGAAAAGRACNWSRGRPNHNHNSGTIGDGRCDNDESQTEHSPTGILHHVTSAALRPLRAIGDDFTLMAGCDKAGSCEPFLGSLPAGCRIVVGQTGW
jgi:hypothetical protein